MKIEVNTRIQEDIGEFRQFLEYRDKIGLIEEAYNNIRNFTKHGETEKIYEFLDELKLTLYDIVYPCE